MTTMRNYIRPSALGVLAAGALAGCNDFISAPSAVSNPNVPSVAAVGLLLTGAETNLTTILSSDAARTVTIWMQQFSGTDRQYQSLAQYSYGEDFSNGTWNQIYQGGGLVDLRTAVSRSDATGDSATAGIARIIEAIDIGTAADLYGDVPYTTASDPSKKATLDKQAAVYDSVQGLLDRAIRQLTSGKGAGPGPADLLYGADVKKWTALAYTLKARYYLHTAEQTGAAADGTPAFSTAAYQSALAAAQNGISAPANDFVSYQSSNPNEQNLWYQFTINQRSGYLAPSDYFVNLLSARSDPRLTYYFEPAAGETKIIGSPVTGGGPDANVSALNSSSGAPGDPGYKQPLVTYAENQLIIAEAQYRLGNTAAALTALNAERANASGGTPLAALAGLPAGAAGLNEIMTEKYIALFENIEVWSDYRRTCLPQRTPVTTSGRIPSRFLYPLSERNTNSANIPAPSAQPPRNPNDPNPCSVNGTQVTD